MSKKYTKLEVVDMEDIKTNDEILEEDEVTEVVKPKWSLKKKLMIGGGVAAGLVLGAIALGSKKATPAEDPIEDSEDDNEEEDDEEELVYLVEEIAETVEE